jgi:hypothetical protein
MQAKAADLMGQARHDGTKEVIRMAWADLAEAMLWLGQDDMETDDSVLRLVDLTIELAGRRLTHVDHALRAYGRNTTIIR